MTTPRGGRPHVGPQRSIRLDDTTWAAIDRLAQTNRVTAAEQIRRLVELGLRALAEQATPAPDRR